MAAKQNAAPLPSAPPPAVATATDAATNETSNAVAPVPAEQPAPDAEPAKPTKPGKRLQVVSKPEQFWRAGMCFTRTPTVIYLTDLSDAALQALRNEPNLVVSEATPEA
jgi:hypothetical protein